MPLTRDDVESHVKAMLGYPLVDVMITGEDNKDEDQFKVLIDQTIRVYNQWRPVIRNASFTAEAQVERYDFDDRSWEYGRKIVDVQPPVHDAVPRSFDSALLGLEGDLTPISRQEGLLDYFARMQEIEMTRRVTATEFDWEWRKENVSGSTHGVLYIKPEPDGGNSYSYLYAVDATLQQIRANDEQWFLDHCEALAKIMLGRARSKWEDQLRMDGSDLLREGKDDKRDLVEDIQERSMPELEALRQVQ